MPLRKSKKEAKKNQQSPSPPISPQEELPQVWLAVDSTNEPRYDDGNHEVEVEQLATYWENEEANDTGGWDGREELDYTQIAASLGLNIEQQEEETAPLPVRPVASSLRPALKDCESVDAGLLDDDEIIQPLLQDDHEDIVTPLRSRLPSVRSPGSELHSETHSLFNYAQSSVYGVNELGQLHDINNDWTGSSPTDPNNLLKLIEHAQRRGLIPWSSQSDSERILVLSKYGIKVTDTKRQRVYTRHTLHTIMTVVHYIDTKGQSLLAVKIQKQNRQHEEEEESGNFNLHIYQCQSENQATDICMMLGQIFDAILNKMKLEDNLGVLR